MISKTIDIGGQSSRSTQVVDHWTQERIRLQERLKRADLVYKCQLKELNYSKRALERILRRKKEAGEYSVEQSEHKIKGLRREISELKSFNHRQSKIRLPPILLLQQEKKEKENLKRLLQTEAALKIREQTLQREFNSRQINKRQKVGSSGPSGPIVLEEEVLKVQINDLKKELSRIKRKDELLTQEMLKLIQLTRLN